MHYIVILGSTGSIGRQALQVVDRHPDKFRVVALAARSNFEELARQTQKYKPLVISVGDNKYCRPVQDLVNGSIRVVTGVEGLCELAAMNEADTVLVAVSGAIGIAPTLAAIRQKKRVALANKETLVAAGDIVMAAAHLNNTEIIPVDSEHSAIFQCLQGREKFLQNIWLTASGGPFLNFTREQLNRATLKMALHNPNWSMGAKVSVDSATLMNKGLEVIEAHHFFQAGFDHIKVLVQPESVLHSMVELVDGSFIAQLGTADMRIPIQYALSYPERYEAPVTHLDFGLLGSIHFQLPATDKFPALELAYAAGREGGSMPAVMNAADEIAVNSFINGEIGFMDIVRVVEGVMNRHHSLSAPGLDDIIAADRWARIASRELINREVKTWR